MVLGKGYRLVLPMLGLLLGLYSYVQAQDNWETLDAKLKTLADENKLPGFSVAIVNQEGFLFQKGYGFADVEKAKPYTQNTLQNIGSASQTVIGLVLMQAINNGKLGLDDDINDYLPFEIVHPFASGKSITIRHLATHTSGIRDAENNEKRYIFTEEIFPSGTKVPSEYKRFSKKYQENIPMAMGVFLENVLTRGGRWYSNRNFLKSEPGAVYEFSNIGAALLAFIIQEATEQPYATLTQNTVFSPMGMKNTFWSLSDAKEQDFITHYIGTNLPLPNYALITFPDGGLMTSTNDLGMLLKELMLGYQGKGKLFDEEVYQQLMAENKESMESYKGIFWVKSPDGYLLHLGEDLGTATALAFNPERNVGLILFSNVSLDQEEYKNSFLEVWNEMATQSGLMSAGNSLSSK
ncbi:serine hydrolase domain-containing protein [Pararhodonellum marinum]|uniref:serine hydrolase domain-containing protein n=1 Tax=Pararhodonellum marinum TaxID=2755358 RepID=UPI00188FEE96|nr:serine hydrolase domain-containing protein [Pararhodonellum marinum]